MAHNHESPKELPMRDNQMATVMIQAEVPGGGAGLCFLDAAQIDTAFANRLRAIRRDRNQSRHAIAERAGVSSDVVQLAETRPWDVPLGKLLAIIGAMGIHAYELTESIGVAHHERQR